MLVYARVPPFTDHNPTSLHGISYDFSHWKYAQLNKQWSAGVLAFMGLLALLYWIQTDQPYFGHATPFGHATRV